MATEMQLNWPLLVKLTLLFLQGVGGGRDSLSPHSLDLLCTHSYTSRYIHANGWLVQQSMAGSRFKGQSHVHNLWFARSVSITKPETVGVPGWRTGTKALCLYSQFPQACKPVHRALTWLTAALMKWNALHTMRCVECTAYHPVCLLQCSCSV